MPATPLSVSDSTIKVANAALSELGVKPIADFSESSLQARTLNTRFADVLEEVLAQYPWRFARTRIDLARSTDTAFPPYDALFDLPTSALNVVAVYEGDQKAIFERFGGQIATFTRNTEVTSVSAEITVTKAPDAWPGYFRRAFILYLASAICMTLTQDERFAGSINQAAQFALMKAKTRDGQGRTPARIDTKKFIRARRNGIKL